MQVKDSLVPYNYHDPKKVSSNHKMHEFYGALIAVFERKPTLGSEFIIVKGEFDKLMKEDVFSVYAIKLGVSVRNVNSGTVDDNGKAIYQKWYVAGRLPVTMDLILYKERDNAHYDVMIAPAFGPKKASKPKTKKE